MFISTKFYKLYADYMDDLKKGWNKCDPRGLTFANFNLHFIKMINNKYHFIWSTWTYKYCIMLYKVYVNLCDIRVGSYVTLGTKAAQYNYISTCHLDDPCHISLHLVYEFIRIFLKNFLFLAPFWGWGPFMTPASLFAQT